MIFLIILNCHFQTPFHLSKRIRKPTTCLGENKGADQLCRNCTPDQHFCFRCMDSTIPLLLTSKISSFSPASVTIQSGLSRTWSETQTVDFLMQKLIKKQTIWHIFFSSVLRYASKTYVLKRQKYYTRK